MGIGERSIYWSSKGVDAPEVHQCPGLVASFSGCDGREGTASLVGACALDETAEEGHGGDLKEGHDDDELLNSFETEIILAGSWLDGVRRYVFTEKDEMASFIVSDLLDPVVSRGGEAEVNEGAFVKYLHGFLVEAEDGPFSRKEVLEEVIVRSWRTVAGRHDGRALISWPRGIFPTIIAVIVVKARFETTESASDEAEDSQ